MRLAIGEDRRMIVRELESNIGITKTRNIKQINQQFEHKSRVHEIHF